MAKRGRKAGGAAAHQLGGDEISDERLRRMVQEAVDQALARIHEVEGDVDGASPALSARLEARRSGLPGPPGVWEQRLQDLERRARAFEDRHARAEQRAAELTHFLSPREPLDLSQVPPDVLERSFQAALDEVVAEVAKVEPVDLLERTLDEAIDDVRGRSKGAELFERHGASIRIRGLAPALRRKLISARAAEATFDAVVKHLRTHVPGFHPRPLAAVVRHRAQDFTLERAAAHQERLVEAEGAIERLLREAERIERDARGADEAAAAAVSKSFMQATMERNETKQELRTRLQALEQRTHAAEAQLEEALGRLEAVERYARRIESGVIRRTKTGEFKGDFTPVIDAVQAALESGAPKTVAQIARSVKGVDSAVVEAVIREGVREGIFEEAEGGKVKRVA
jgi:hypothetical protein